MPDVSFTEAREQDVETIIRLRQKIWATTYRGIYPDEMIDAFDWDWHREKELVRIQHPDYAEYLILCGSSAIGYLILRKGEEILLQSMYISAEHQRQGIGTAAFAFIRQYCQKKCADSFICHCQPENTGARTFYERMGGIIIGQNTGNDARWMDSVIYRFTL